jgi:hypothetical protein
MDSKKKIQIGNNNLITIIVNDENGNPVHYGVDANYMNIVTSFGTRNVYDFNVPVNCMTIILKLVHDIHVIVNDDDLLIKLMNFSAKLGIRDIFLNFGYMMMNDLYMISANVYKLFMEYCLQYTREPTSYTLYNEEDMNNIMVRVTKKVLKYNIDLGTIPYKLSLYMLSLSNDMIKKFSRENNKPLLSTDLHYLVCNTSLLCPTDTKSPHNHSCKVVDGIHYPSRTDGSCIEHIWQCRNGQMKVHTLTSEEDTSIEFNKLYNRRKFEELFG